MRADAGGIGAHGFALRAAGETKSGEGVATGPGTKYDRGLGARLCDNRRTNCDIRNNRRPTIPITSTMVFHQR